MKAWQVRRICVFMYLCTKSPQISEDVRGQQSAISSTRVGEVRVARRVWRALLPRLDCSSQWVVAAQHHSSYCHLVPFNNTIQLCYCFYVFVISSSEYQYLYSLLNSKSCPNKWLEFWRTPGDITDWDLGIIWMKQILIQQLLYHTLSLLSMCSCFEQAVMDVLPATHVLLKNHNWTWHTAQ